MFTIFLPVEMSGGGINGAPESRLWLRNRPGATVAWVLVDGDACWDIDAITGSASPRFLVAVTLDREFFLDSGTYILAVMQETEKTKEAFEKMGNIIEQWFSTCDTRSD